MLHNILKKGIAVTLALVFLLCALPTAFADDFDESAYELTGDGAMDIIGVAYTQVGYYSDGGWTKYGEEYGFPYMPWCAAFIVWCVNRAGVSTEIIPKDGSSNSLKNYYESRGQYHDDEDGPPLPGDIAFFSYTYSVYNISHVGLVTAVAGGTVYMVEGNYSSHVAKTEYEIGDPRIVGYASPDYGSGTTGYRTGRYVTGYALNLRVSYDEYSTRLTTMPKGTVLYVTEVHGAWGKVTYDGMTGWCHLGYCTYKPVVTHTDQTIIADISRWNDPDRFHWDAFQSDGVTGVIIRVGGRGYAGEREIYDDIYFLQFYKAAKAAGLHVGFYFFSYALTPEEAEEEADYVIRRLRENDCEPDLPVYIDIEDYAEGDTYDFQHERAGGSACTAVVNAFCDRIEEAGYYPGVYCNKNYAENLIDPSAFEGRSFWIAHYGVPVCGYQGRYDLWQYTPYGQTAGYDGYIDLSYCYVDYPALITGEPSFGKEPVEPDVTTDSGEHTISESWTVTKEPTCFSLGERVKKCTDCGVVLEKETFGTETHTCVPKKAVRLLDRLIDAGDTVTADYESRLYDFDEVSLLACQQSGGTVLTYCTSCKKVLEADYYYIDQHPGEDHVKETENIPATCSEPGMVTDYCTVCRKILRTEALTPYGHVQGATGACTATCAGPGETEILCARCGDVCATRYAAAGEHVFGEPDVTAEATFYREGAATVTCAVCGLTEERVVPKLVLGDVDGDCAVNSNDARVVLRVSVGLETLGERAAVCADTDASGAVDSTDARNVLRIAVGLESSDALLEQYY